MFVIIISFFVHNNLSVGVLILDPKTALKLLKQSVEGLQLTVQQNLAFSSFLVIQHSLGELALLLKVTTGCLCLDKGEDNSSEECWHLLQACNLTLSLRSLVMLSYCGASGLLSSWLYFRSERVILNSTMYSS